MYLAQEPKKHSLTSSSSALQYNDIWTFTVQRSNYTIALAYYLTTGRLISKSQSLEALGLSQVSPSRLTLTTEEYLHSLISVINDFSRLAVNAVTMHDYVTPLRLSEFVKDLSAGFGLLNLKNDSLRKRFDSIKVSDGCASLETVASR